MRTRRWALGGLMAALALAAGAAAQVTKPAPAPAPGAKAEAKATLAGGVATASKQKEEVVAKVLAALGPAVRDKLRAGEQVELPGLGTFRVVQVAPHRDLVDGRPARVPAKNYVEFVPDAALAGAAEAPGAVPARVVPAFEYVPLPDRTPGGKTEGLKTRGTRTR